MACAVGLAACGTPDSVVGDDQDGIVGGDVAFEVTADDATFSPAILKAQNLANVTLVLTNAGTRPHGLVIGCSAGSCFPSAAAILPIAPGASATAVFMTPRVEGIYPVGANGDGDAPSGQFIVQ